METKNILGGNIRNERLDTVALACGSGFDPNIEEITVKLEKLDVYNFSDETKKTASKLKVANKKLQVCLAEFDIARNLLQLAKGNAQLESVRKNNAKKIADKIKTASKEVDKLFAQLKNEYIAWYDKKVPDRAKKARFIFSPNDVYLNELYTWFKIHAYDIAKCEVVLIKT